jgi:hypothetical protein
VIVFWTSGGRPSHSTCPVNAVIVSVGAAGDDEPKVGDAVLPAAAEGRSEVVDEAPAEPRVEPRSEEQPLRVLGIVTSGIVRTLLDDSLSEQEGERLVEVALLEFHRTPAGHLV